MKGNTPGVEWGGGNELNFQTQSCIVFRMYLSFRISTNHSLLTPSAPDSSIPTRLRKSATSNWHSRCGEQLHEQNDTTHWMEAFVYRVIVRKGTQLRGVSLAVLQADKWFMHVFEKAIFVPDTAVAAWVFNFSFTHSPTNFFFTRLTSVVSWIARTAVDIIIVICRLARLFTAYYYTPPMVYAYPLFSWTRSWLI